MDAGSRVFAQGAGSASPRTFEGVPGAARLVENRVREPPASAPVVESTAGEIACGWVSTKARVGVFLAAYEKRLGRSWGFVWSKFKETRVRRRKRGSGKPGGVPLEPRVTAGGALS